MSNTIYIDANRLNSVAVQDATNEWTYKLNTEMELPKGTQISIQNSFINKKGITGGSLEIEQDIIEEITYFFYATEQPHFAPLGHNDGSAGNTWCRQTWGTDTFNFRGCFQDVSTTATAQAQATEVQNGTSSIAMDDIKRLLRGDGIYQDTNFADKFFNPDLVCYGGTGMICPMVEWNTNSTGAGNADVRYMNPVAFTKKIFIPKGVYSIGSIAQLIEDQMNGLVYNAGNDNKIKIKRKTDTSLRMDDYSDVATSLLPFDGQPYNRPLITQVNALRRDFNIHSSKPIAPFIDTDVSPMRGFTTMEQFSNLVNYGKYIRNPRDSNEWTRAECSNTGATDYANSVAVSNRYGIIPFFFFRQNYDTGANLDGMGHLTDPDETILEYSLYGYDATLHNRRFRQIGTSNFQFKYNTEQNAYTIGGLHNQIRSPSHDRFGTKNNTAGQPVINFKKINNNATIIDDGVGATINTEKGKIDVAELIGRLNKPETRNMGVSVMNWGKSTALKYGDNFKSTTAGGEYVDDGTGKPLFENFLRFGEFFTTDKKARDAWKKTIWFRLGFQYDDIQNHNYDECFGTTQIYNKKYTDENGTIHTTGFPNYGFTTDEVIDNTIIPTISTLNNPAEFIPKKDDVSASGFQQYTLDNMGLPNFSMGENGGKKDIQTQGQYAGGLLMSSQQIPVVVADVGDVLATELPTLSESAYYLITSDICDNYKDNVKKGDVLPLLGVVPKSNLSNQDFIVSENQITQVLSQTKVINKISVKILNADLTAPDLAPNSSILIKLVKPNTTPVALLEEENPKIYKQLQQASQNF
tara:strand:+ start:1215 stop:3635 length:2421 start_codon:yes stop_codon:yes gene_type:complete